MKILFNSVSVQNVTKFIYLDVLGGGELMEIPLDVSQNLEGLKGDIEKQERYDKVYEEIVEEDMDMPKENWEDICKISHKDWKHACNIPQEKISSREVHFHIGMMDEYDLDLWFMTTDGVEFLNGEYENLEDYVNKRALRPKTPEERIKETDVYNEVYEEIVEEDMDMPKEDWKDIYKIPREKYLEIPTDEDAEISLEIKIGWMDVGDILGWLRTIDGLEFLNGEYKDLNDYVAKKAIERKK